MGRLIGRAAIVLAVTLVIYVVVDLIAGLIIGPLHRETPDFAAIPGFRGQPYATPGFAFEYTEMQSFDTVLGTRLLMPALRHGDYYNVDQLPPTEAHYRRTINPDPPRTPTRLVLVIGGSLVFGPAVPDAMTIPSLLSARLNGEDGTQGYKLLNAGVDGAVSGQELARLRYELDHGLKPDLVVVIDGPVDFAQGVYAGEPGGFALSGREHDRRADPSLCALAYLRLAAVSPRGAGDGSGLAQGASPSAGSGAARCPHPGIHRHLCPQPARHGHAWPRRAGPVPAGGQSDARQLRLYPSDGGHRLCHGSGKAALSRASRGFAPDPPGAGRGRREPAQPGRRCGQLSDLLRDKTVDVFVETAHFNATGHEMIAAAIAREILHGAAP